MELILCFMDAAVILISLMLSGGVRYGSLQRWFAIEDVRLLSCVVILLHIALFYLMKMSEGFFRRGRYRELAFCVRHNVVIIIFITFLSFAIKNELLMSRLQMGGFFLISTILLWLTHILVRNRERFQSFIGVKRENLMIVTTADMLDHIMENFQRSKETIWSISGIVLLDTDESGKAVGGVPVLGARDDYYGYAQRHVVDEVFIRVGSVQENETLLKEMIAEFENMGLVVNLNLDLFHLPISGEKRVYTLEGYPVLAFSSRLLDYRMVFVKRLMDIVGASAGLLLTVPIGMILAPFLLLESPGPLIFKQKRIGKNGRTFEFYKFRSMYADAEERKQELMEQNEMQGAMFKMENDPRITKVGRFIRKTSIDELPQFWNVLKGDMSLVGTRPPTLDEFQRYKPYQRRRLSFSPGITGLWQISGRSDIRDFDEVVKLDLEYIDHWSLMLDVKIILKTIVVIFRGSGAR